MGLLSLSGEELGFIFIRHRGHLNQLVELDQSAELGETEIVISMIMVLVCKSEMTCSIH